MKNIHQLTFETLLAERQGQATSPEQRALADAHLASCARCRQEARLFQRLRSEAAQNWTFTAQPRTSPAQIAIAIQERLGRQKRRERVMLPVRLLAGLGAAAILVAGLAWILSTLRLQPLQTPAPTLPSGIIAPGTPTGTPTALPLKPPETRLNASDYQAYDFFGASVGISGDILAAGAPGKDTLGEDAGGVYVFERQGDTWVETVQLLPPSLGAGDRLGEAVAVDEETVVAGAPYATTSAGFAAGKVYIFNLPNGVWKQQAELTAPDAGSFDLFGWSLALEGEYLVVGARAADDARKGRNSGAAYIFHRQDGDWEAEARLSPDDGQADDFFGDSVAIYGEFVAMGAPGRDDSQIGQNSGAVYVYQMDTGALFGPVVSAQPKAEARFGASLGFAAGPNRSIWLAVGANQYSPEPLDPGYAGVPGAVELFQWQGKRWSPVAHFVPPIDNQRESMLSSSLALGAASGKRAFLAVGSEISRKIYLYADLGSGWEQAGAIEPDEFQGLTGQSLALDGTLLAAGSRWDGQWDGDNQMFSPEYCGAVHLYDLDGIK